MPTTPIMPRPRLVLFDLDDTLCDYAGARFGRLRRAFGDALAQVPGGEAVDLDRLVEESIAIQPHGSDHFGELLTRYGAGRAELVQRARDWFHANRFHGLRLFPGAADLLADLRRLDPAPRIGLVTNGPTEVQRGKIALLGLDVRVDFAVISEEFGAPKPDGRIFAEALRLGGASAEETVFAGDSLEFDIAGARGAGIRAIWMDHGRVAWPHGIAKPDWTVRDIDGLRALLLA
jgi:HAD superfamily hydrolase (TIGR01549 family)